MDKNQQKQKTGYRIERDRILSKMAETEPGTPEYRQLLVSLNGLETSDNVRKSRRPTGDKIIAAATTVVSNVCFFVFESENPVRSKLIGFLPKLMK